VLRRPLRVRRRPCSAPQSKVQESALPNQKVDDLRFGLVGETVIIASRLESHTRILNVPLLVSASVVDHLQDFQGLTIGLSQLVSLKGIDHDVLAHSVIGDQSACPLI